MYRDDLFYEAVNEVNEKRKLEKKIRVSLRCLLC